MNTNTSTKRVIRSQRVQHQGHRTLIGPNLAPPGSPSPDHVHQPEQLSVSRVETSEDGTVTAIYVRCLCGAELIIDCLHESR